MIGRVLPSFALWLLLAGLYALFAGEVSLSEAIAGLLATGIALAYAAFLHRSRSRRISVRGLPFRVVFAPLGALLPDAWRVGRVLARAVLRRPAGAAGTLSRPPFREGGREAREAGRRGLVTLGLSLAPNGYVVNIEADALILHRLAPAAPSPDREWPS